MERLNAKCSKREFININFLKNLERKAFMTNNEVNAKRKNCKFRRKDFFLAILFLIIQARIKIS